MDWIIAAVAVVGVALNVKKKWQGFICWLFTNAFWFGRNLHIGQYAQAMTFAVFFVVCFYGIWTWRICKKERDTVTTMTVWICRQLVATRARLSSNPGRVKIQHVIDKAEDLLGKLENEEQPFEIETGRITA